ncbi:Protein translocase subunit SecDF [bioreactor metagenome]|uniref:Protein translocase subunit SecDF n=1 Tax=bioreactor metagenome TaxID=1076179 RepID=A0A645JBZ1_9ZZZZ
MNDTIVIYDRIRENRLKMDKKSPIGDIVNLSINQSFTRSFNTGFCTFLAIATVAVLSMFYGLDSITSFALPMMVGVISGCYSTVCICGPLWVMWKNHRMKTDTEKNGDGKKLKA